MGDINEVRNRNQAQQSERRQTQREHIERYASQVPNPLQAPLRSTLESLRNRLNGRAGPTTLAALLQEEPLRAQMLSALSQVRPDEMDGALENFAGAVAAQMGRAVDEGFIDSIRDELVNFVTRSICSETVETINNALNAMCQRMDRLAAANYAGAEQLVRNAVEARQNGIDNGSSPDAFYREAFVNTLQNFGLSERHARHWEGVAQRNGFDNVAYRQLATELATCGSQQAQADREAISRQAERLERNPDRLLEFFHPVMAQVAGQYGIPINSQGGSNTSMGGQLFEEGISRSSQANDNRDLFVRTVATLACNFLMPPGVGTAVSIGVNLAFSASQSAITTYSNLAEAEIARLGAQQGLTGSDVVDALNNEIYISWGVGVLGSSLGVISNPVIGTAASVVYGEATNTLGSLNAGQNETQTEPQYLGGSANRRVEAEWTNREFYAGDFQDPGI